MLLSSDIKIRTLVGICLKDVPLKEDKCSNTLLDIECCLHNTCTSKTQLLGVCLQPEGEPHFLLQ